VDNRPTPRGIVSEPSSLSTWRSALLVTQMNPHLVDGRRVGAGFRRWAPRGGLRRDGGGTGRPARPWCCRGGAAAGVEPGRRPEHTGEVAGAGGTGLGPGGTGVSAGNRRGTRAGFDAARVPVAVSCETRLRAPRCVGSGVQQTCVGLNHGGRRRASRPVLPPEEGFPR